MLIIIGDSPRSYDMKRNHSISQALRDIADKEILTSLFMKDYSLMNGQMGCAIFFALLSRVSGNHWYEDFADELLENICENLTIHHPVNFGSGLCGIGWGIEFLKYQGFIAGDTDEILVDVDNAVMERDVRRISDISLENGLSGILAYVESRLNTQRTNLNYQPFDSIYLSDLSKAIENRYISTPEKSIESTWKECINAFNNSSALSWKKGLVIMNS